jgi:hypothetical protein
MANKINQNVQPDTWFGIALHTALVGGGYSVAWVRPRPTSKNNRGLASVSFHIRIAFLPANSKASFLRPSYTHAGRNIFTLVVPTPRARGAGGIMQERRGGPLPRGGDAFARVCVRVACVGGRLEIVIERGVFFSRFSPSRFTRALRQPLTRIEADGRRRRRLFLGHFHPHTTHDAHRRPLFASHVLRASSRRHALSRRRRRRSPPHRRHSPATFRSKWPKPPRRRHSTRCC